MNGEGPEAQPPGRVPGRSAPGDHSSQAPGPDSSSLLAEFEPPHLRVEPGAAGTITIRVRNTGPVVDEVSLGLRSPAIAWATITPTSLRLYPGTDGEARGGPKAVWTTCPGGEDDAR